MANLAPRPLASAAQRLRESPPPGFPSRPGRPRKAPAPGSALAHEASALLAPRVAPRQERASGGPGRGVPEIVPVLPRLLDLPGAAAYLSVSSWTIRDLEAAGVLHRVRVPLPNHGELRKLLFDREDLDRLIAAWKDGGSL